MNTITYSAFRNSLAKTLDQVNEDHMPIIITRQNGEPAVVMSLEDFKAYEETAYLMASPENAKRLSLAIKELESGAGSKKDIIE